MRRSVSEHLSLFSAFMILTPILAPDVRSMLKQLSFSNIHMFDYEPSHKKQSGRRRGQVNRRTRSDGAKQSLPQKCPKFCVVWQGSREQLEKSMAT